MNTYSICTMVTTMDEKLILLSDGTLIAMTIKGCDPEWIKLYKGAIPGMNQNEQILSSSGCEDSIICILSKSRLSIIFGFDRITTRSPQEKIDKFIFQAKTLLCFRSVFYARNSLIFFWRTVIDSPNLIFAF